MHIMFTMYYVDYKHMFTNHGLQREGLARPAPTNNSCTKPCKREKEKQAYTHKFQYNTPFVQDEKRKNGGKYLEKQNAVQYVSFFSNSTERVCTNYIVRQFGAGFFRTATN